MGLLKHYINGKVKPQSKQEDYCDVCKNGDAWNGNDFFRDGPHDGHIKDLICGVCITKYFRPKVNVLDLNDLDKFIEITYEQLKEVFEMNENVATKREEFEKTKECSNHIWIETQPFRIADGSVHSIKNCAVCALATTEFNGKVYQDKLWNLVNWLSQKGIVSKEAKKVNEMSKFADIGVEVDEKLIDFTDLLAKNDKPKLSFL